MRASVTALCLAFLSTSAAALPANTLWYSGDPNLSHWGDGTSPTELQHWQAFDVTAAAGWDIGSVFMGGDSYGNTTAQWSIRIGMSPGNPGTTIASGVGPVTTTPLGAAQIIDVAIAPLHLASGIYWLEVAPVSVGEIWGTNGINSVGTTPPLASLRNWAFSGQFYQPYDDFRLSEGVAGVVTPTPEPASLALLALGLAGLGLRRRKTA
jgi:hypothetical protein